MVSYFTEDTSFAFKEKRLTSRWLKLVAESEIRRLGDISIVFCSDNYILDVNMKYLQHDYFTDIITFDNSDDFFLETGRKGVSADIYISIDTVKANGAAYGEGFERELHRVIVHGLLHLVGYDDVSEWKQRRMRAAENRALKLLDAMRAGE